MLVSAPLGVQCHTVRGGVTFYEKFDFDKLKNRIYHFRILAVYKLLKMRRKYFKKTIIVQFLHQSQ